MADPKNPDINTVFLASVPTPGLAIVEGSSGSPRKWQELGGYALSGATIKFTGLGLAKFDILLKLYDAADWAAWNAPKFQAALKPPSQTDQRALTVAHPYLKAVGISQCVIEDISLPRTDEYGVTSIILSCREYRKPRPIKFLSPVQSAKVTPTDPVNAEMDANRALIAAKAQALALSDDEFRRRFPNGA